VRDGRAAGGGLLGRLLGGLGSLLSRALAAMNSSVDSRLAPEAGVSLRPHALPLGTIPESAAEVGADYCNC
jgi:hypothetical protein